MDFTVRDKRSRQGEKPRTTVLPSKVRDLTMRYAPKRILESVSECIEKTQQYYRAQQHQDGYWWSELESNVTISAEYLMLFHFLGISDAARDAKVAAYIARNQRPDGTWAIHWGGAGDLSTTIEAYFALKLAGVPHDTPSLKKAKAFILEQGGVEHARVFTKVFLALFGEFDWRYIPSIPVELNLVPTWFPINIYNLSSWARSTIVPLSLLLEYKPVRPTPNGAGIQELYRDPSKKPPLVAKRISPFSWRRFFVLSDKMLKIMERTHIRPLRRIGINNTFRWIMDHQEESGDWGGIQPAMINSILALAAMGYGLESIPVKKGLEALERFTVEKDGEISLQSCISPVWDTALASLALTYSGVNPGHDALVRASRWLASKQISRKGDWSVKRPDLAPGGWAFEFENNWYPDIDDTAVVLMFLSHYKNSESIEICIKRGLQWIIGMQGSDGGWGAFDVDNNLKILNQLPFGDLEAMIDPSTPDITGRVLELLGTYGYTAAHPLVSHAVAFLKKNQDPSGGWWGRWGVNYLYGTSSVLCGLASVKEAMTSPYVQKSVEWLKMHQNTDGGWGECCESYTDPALKCMGMSTPSQTAWALLGLIAAGEQSSGGAQRGIQYLIEKQKAEGTWEEQAFTGTGFPKYFMIRYHNYCNCFPLMALGKFRAACMAREVHS